MEDKHGTGKFAQPIYKPGVPLPKRFDEINAGRNEGKVAEAPSAGSAGNKAAKPDYSELKIVLAMVGLPASGKSYLSNKLMRYLKWLEYDVKVFNVGHLRRSRERHVDTEIASKPSSVHDAKARSDKLAEDCLEMLIQWLKDGGNLGILDATDSTLDQSGRGKIATRVATENGFSLFFLESTCDDPSIIAGNVALKVAAGDPRYKDVPLDTAERDVLDRIQKYKDIYQTIDEPQLSYLKIKNIGQQVTVCRLDGYLQSRIAFYLMNLHTKPRSIFLTRHGESEFNVEQKIGGDAPLSPRGHEYADSLPDLMAKTLGGKPFAVWTSTLYRTIQTARDLPYPKLTWKSLDELDAGVCDGMTYEEIEAQYPEDFANRDDDKYNYRYRGGESYRDLVVRLEPVIMELERHENVLIIAHQAILRCLYAYFQNLSQDDLPYIKIPLHCIIKLTPRAYGCDEERYISPVPAVDTHRAKPKPKPKATASSADR